MREYDPKNWYWLSGDCRLYPSVTQAILDENDAAYKEWVAAGGRATRWPVDDEGNETDAALLAVLSALSSDL